MHQWQSYYPHYGIWTPESSERKNIGDAEEKVRRNPRLSATTAVGLVWCPLWSRRRRTSSRVCSIRSVVAWIDETCVLHNSVLASRVNKSVNRTQYLLRTQEESYIQRHFVGAQLVSQRSNLLFLQRPPPALKRL